MADQKQCANCGCETRDWYEQAGELKPIYCADCHERREQREVRYIGQTKTEAMVWGAQGFEIIPRLSLGDR